MRHRNSQLIAAQLVIPLWIIISGGKLDLSKPCSHAIFTERIFQRAWQMMMRWWLFAYAISRNIVYSFQ